MDVDPTQPLTVTQLTAAIRQQLEGIFPFVRLQGEVSNAKLHSSGHFYFSLKDQNAQIAAVMFRQECLRLSRIPKDGDQVILSASLQVYPPMGRYQINVKELQYAGVGELLLKLHALKTKLEQLGWFDPKRKKPLPSHPKVIGVVTSPTGAAIQDILNILSRRFTGFQLILNPVRVQGEGAAVEIAKAIDDFNRHRLADVLIVGRGGGSLEDLWAFNEEIVVQAIFRSQIPIISAVGHETDTCLSDYVADIRAPTPSAAAELVMAELKQQLEWLSQMQRRLLQTLKLLIGQDRRRLEGVTRHPLMQAPRTLLNFWSQRVDEMMTGIDQALGRQLSHKRLLLSQATKRQEALRPANQLIHTKHRLSQFEQQLNRSWERQSKQKMEQVKQCREMLSALNPRHLLSRGYTILFSEKTNCAITSVSELVQGCRVRMQLADGEAVSVVEELSTQLTSEANVVL